MAALVEGVMHSPLARPQPAAGRTIPAPDPPGLTAGLAYASRCLRGHRPFGIITGRAPGLQALADRLAENCSAREDLHLVRIASPSDDVLAFLTDCLAQLGFELLQADLDDLRKLLTVFLRHESARGRRTVAIIDATEHCGPHMLEFMKTLSAVRAGATPAMTFILTGSPDLHRILDSRGMAGLRPFTRERYDLERAVAWIAAPLKVTGAAGPQSNGHKPEQMPVAGATVQHSLVELRNGAMMERHVLRPGRLLIGRSKTSGLRLVSPYVSRHHAALVVTPDKVVIVDLRSTNSTLVNGKALVNGRAAPSQELETGDVVSIGNFRLRYDCPAANRPGSLT